MESWERIETLINHFNLNKNSFSKEIGINNNVTIGRILNEHRKASNSTIEKICTRFPNINKDWLTTGQGEMIREYEPQKSSKNQNIMQESDASLYDTSKSTAPSTEEVMKVIEMILLNEEELLKYKLYANWKEELLLKERNRTLLEVKNKIESK